MIQYEKNEDAELIGSEVIALWHPHLAHARIFYLSKISPKSRKTNPTRQKKVVLAKISRVSPKMQALIGKDYDFVIEINFNTWVELTSAQQQALIDHECCHANRDDNGWYLRPHDLEDFSACINRHGMYLDDIRNFLERVDATLHASSEVSLNSVAPVVEEAFNV